MNALAAGRCGARRDAWVLGPLVVDGIDADLASALALVGTAGDNEKCDSDDAKDGEENKRNHQVLPGPSPLMACAREAASHYCS